jgi:hypothetical protein
VKAEILRHTTGEDAYKGLAVGLRTNTIGANDKGWSSATLRIDTRLNLLVRNRRKISGMGKEPNATKVQSSACRNASM